MRCLWLIFQLDCFLIVEFCEFFVYFRSQSYIVWKHFLLDPGVLPLSFFFCLFKAAPWAHGGSQARD